MCPEQVVYTFGSLGGPHHGLRSRQMSSPKASVVQAPNTTRHRTKTSPPATHGTIRMRDI
jgi:hypothetical protein